jgi:hypothetical protein
MFLLWPLLLAVVMVNTYWSNLPVVLAYVAIVLIVCLTTATIALFCSVTFRKTSISLMTTYLAIAVLFMLPPAVTFFAGTFFPGAAATRIVEQAGFTSPFAAAVYLPVDPNLGDVPTAPPDWWFFASFATFYLAFDGVLLATMTWLFNVRWRMDY